jgi:F0F1-type ATP synthase assembly protein I
MKKKLPGILLLAAMPCSVLLFVKVQDASGSDALALFAALFLYAAVFIACALVFNKPDPRNVKMEHPIVKDETPAKDAETNDANKEN